jgi:ABC-type multidrug transport system fused ATPase/permease subunit
MRTFPDHHPGTPDHRSPGRYLRWLARGQPGQLLACVAFGVTCMLAQSLVPLAIGRAIDAGIIARDRAALLLWAAVLLGLAMLQALTSIMRDRFAVTNRLAASFPTLRLVTGQACRLGASLPNRARAGEVVSIGATDITSIGIAFARLGRGTGAAAGVVATAAVMLDVSWQLGLLVLAGVPLMVWALAGLIRPLHARQRRLRDQQAELTARAVDIVGGLRVLRGVRGEPVFGARYREESQRVRRAAVEIASVQAMFSGAKVLLPGLLTAVLVWLGATLVVAGSISAGQLVSFYAYAVFLVGPLRWLTFAADDLTKGYVAARRITDFLALEPELVTTGEPRALDGPAALSDPDSGLVVEPGRFTAVVCAGPDEAAVLANRLGRYEDSSASYGGIPLREIPLDQVRERILVARNDASLFAGPLRTELDPAGRGTGEPGLLDQVTGVASARDLVDALPGGYDGMVAEAARNFSGGERQRLRLVRALMADPEVLVLVDGTSAVDAHTEARIARRLRQHRAGRTTVAFTTSPIVLAQAERAAYVADGRVVAAGTPAELLADERCRRVVGREDGS